jgi:hypothetical protein
MSDAYRVSAEVLDALGRTTSVSFIVRSGAPGWPWAVEQAHKQLEGCAVLGLVSVDQIWPPEPEPHKHDSSVCACGWALPHEHRGAVPPPPLGAL